MTDQIDILLATYQGGSYLKEQLQSMMQQTYPHFHLIIRDEGSTDETLSIIHSFCHTYPERISVIPSKQRLGVQGNFSELMKHADAPYVMFCDQDDIWLSHKVAASLAKMKAMEKQQGTSLPLLVHTDLTVVDQHLNVLSPSFWKYSKLKPQNAHFLNRLLAHNVITGCTMLVNKPLLQLAGAIPQEAIMHDWWLGLIASACGHIDYLAIPTMLYRQHSKNDIGAKNWTSLVTYVAYAKKVSQLMGREELRQRLLKTICQASRFLQQYEACLDPQKKRIVQNYVALGSTDALKKRYLFLKHRYFKNTYVKNIGMFLFL